MADECSFVFPTDLVIEREDVPSVCGVREGSGILYYKCKKHPEWSVFILKGTWEDNILHGSFSLYHNTHELLYGVYKQGVLFFKGKRCDKGIQITEHGCFPIKSEQIISRESSKVITIIPSEKKEEPIQLTDAAKNEDEESFPCEDEQMNDSEEESDEDKSDDEEEDTDETPSFRVKEKESGEIQRYKQIIYSHLTSIIQCHFVEYENPSSHRILWYFLSSQYCLITTTTGNIPHGTCFLYSLQPLRLVCIGKVRRSSVESLRLVNESTKLHKKERAVMDLGSSGVRWEGEINNQLPNGEGEFYNNNNELIYQGMTIGGYANGFGKAFFPGGEMSYYGMWKGNQRHGVGKEYDRKGTFICDGIWIEGKKAEYIDLVNDMNVPTLNLSHYPPITKCMFINDNIYRSTPLVITHFPFLEAVFLTVRSIHSVPVTLRNLPSLRKFVLEETRKMYPELPLFIRKCPKLNEIWLSVSFKHGVIEVIDDDDEFKDRFVLQELKDSMKWKQTGDIDRDSINQYFPPQHYSYTDENDFPLGSAGGKYYESNTIPKGVWNCHTPLSLFFNRYDYLDLDKTVEAHYRHVHYFGYWKKE